MKTLITACMLILALGQTALASDPYIELLRSDLRTEKVAILTEALAMTEAESEAFWPIYREYDVELSAIMDSRIANLKKYADHFDSMTNEMASELIKTSFKLTDERTKVTRKYFKKLEKATSTALAVRFLQVEHQIELLVDLQVSMEVPLIPIPEEAPAN